MIQIFGTKKCKETQKAIRFFKERKIKTQFIDLNIKGMSAGELESVKRVVGIESMINRESKIYKKQNLEYMLFDIEEKLLDEPLLLKTPVLRNAKNAIIGFDSDTLKSWL